jgi:hypothetical protein
LFVNDLDQRERSLEFRVECHGRNTNRPFRNADAIGKVRFKGKGKTIPLNRKAVPPACCTPALYF